MIGHFLHRLRGNVGDPLVRRSRQRLQQFQMIDVEEEVPHQRLTKITVRTFDQQQVPEIPCVAQIGQIVGASAFAFDLCGQPQPHLRLADEIQRDIRQSDVFLQRRGMPTPLGIAMPEDQRRIAGAQQELEERVLVGIG